MFIISSLKELRLKCHKLSESQTLLRSNEEIDSKIVAIRQYYYEMKNDLELAHEMNKRAAIEEMRNISLLHNLLKEFNDIRQENNILEKYIHTVNTQCDTIRKYKQENDYLQLVYEKNIKTISRLKEENMLNTNSSQNISFNDLPSLLDLDNSFMGFDSVIVTKSETKIDPQYKSYQSVYYKIQKDSAGVQSKVDSILNLMKQTNLSIKISIEDLNLVASQITHKSKETKYQCNTIFLKNDQDVINMLIKKRWLLEQIKLNILCHLNILESDVKAMGNRIKVKRIPIHFTQNNYYPSWYLKKLSIQHLYRIWSKITQWLYNLEKTNN